MIGFGLCRARPRRAVFLLSFTIQVYMTLQQFANRLRKIANDVDDLLGLDRPSVHETAETAHKIRRTFKKKRGSAKGFRYKLGMHWTQTARGRKIMASNARKARKARKAEKAATK